MNDNETPTIEQAEGARVAYAVALAALAEQAPAQIETVFRGLAEATIAEHPNADPDKLLTNAVVMLGVLVQTAAHAPDPDALRAALMTEANR